MLRRLLFPPFGLLALLLACALLPLTSSCGDNLVPVAAIAGPLTTGDGPQPDFVDAQGHRYVWQRKIPKAATAGQPRKTEPRKMTPGSWRKPATVELMAEQMRPHLITQEGHDFMAADVDVDAARRAFEDIAPPETGASEGVLPKDPAATTSNFVIANWSSALNCGRFYYPERTSVWMNDGCSAVVIGPHTVVTAAHCFYEYGAWKNQTVLTPAADKGDSTPCNTTQPYGTWTSFDIWIPNQWMASEDVNWDYSVMHVYPGGGVNIGNMGWMGTSGIDWNDTSELRRNSFPFLDSHYPVEWKSYGYGSSVIFGPNKSYSNDSWSGDSGGGVYKNADYQIRGVHKGEITYSCGWFSNCSTNIFREWTSDFYSLAVASGSWP